MSEAARRDIVAVLPADHRVRDEESFREALAAARDAAAAGDRVLTLGVRPTHAETGYGWLEVGETLDAKSGLARVARFVEKPDRAAAERLLAAGALWNGGIFVFRGTTLLAHLENLAPEIACGLAAAAAEPARARDLYAALPAISIDYAVMEKLADLATVPLDCGWSDLGSWAALAATLPRDASGNVLWSEGGHLAVLGVSGLVVVRTADTVLVLPRERAQDVRRLVEALAAAGRDELL
jgi:mannose-1-phosphate guanylyltransferase